MCLSQSELSPPWASKYDFNLKSGFARSQGVKAVSSASEGGKSNSTLASPIKVIMVFRLVGKQIETYLNNKIRKYGFSKDDLLRWRCTSHQNTLPTESVGKALEEKNAERSSTHALQNVNNRCTEKTSTCISWSGIPVDGWWIHLP